MGLLQSHGASAAGRRQKGEGRSSLQTTKNVNWVIVKVNKQSLLQKFLRKLRRGQLKSVNSNK